MRTEGRPPALTIRVSLVDLERAAAGAQGMSEDAGGDRRPHLPSLVSKSTRETAGVRMKSWEFQFAFRNGRELSKFFGKEKRK